jgi:hypothetical protein
LLPGIFNCHKSTLCGEMISGCWDSRGGINITRTRQTVTLHLPCLSWFWVSASRFSANCLCHPLLKEATTLHKHSRREEIKDSGQKPKKCCVGKFLHSTKKPPSPIVT